MRGNSVSPKAKFHEYIEAFNAGDSTAYTRFYAPDAVLINGAGDKLCGPTAIAEFYDELKQRAQRQIEVLGLVEGRNTLAAALRSTFLVISEGMPFAGHVLNVGDRAVMRSIVLYELDGGKFRRIQAQTLDRKIMRAGLAGRGGEEEEAAT
jgi:hypothetical protein